MGRPRKPTTLKIVAGTDRASRMMPNEPAPKPAAAPPEPPAHLRHEARICWQLMAEILQNMGVLTEADVFAFERLCVAYADLRALDFQLEALGSTTYETVSPRHGLMRRSHPECAQRAEAERRFLMYLGQFGLTPAARTKISIPGQDGSDTFAKYFS